jgi:hypothetical protein
MNARRARQKGAGQRDFGDEVRNSRVSGSRRSFLQKSGVAAMLGMSKVFAGASTLPSGSPEHRSDPIGPDPIYEKPTPQTVERLAGSKIAGVAAVEVNDYSPAGYKGSFKPSPPHADLNPKRAIIVLWKDHSHRVIFSHEASYCPWMELPNGVGLGNQFFEGNSGYAELFNQWLDKGDGCAGAESIASLPPLRIQPA